LNSVGRRQTVVVLFGRLNFWITRESWSNPKYVDA